MDLTPAGRRPDESGGALYWVDSHLDLAWIPERRTAACAGMTILFDEPNPLRILLRQATEL